MLVTAHSQWLSCRATTRNNHLSQSAVMENGGRTDGRTVLWKQFTCMKQKEKKRERETEKCSSGGWAHRSPCFNGSRGLDSRFSILCLSLNYFTACACASGSLDQRRANTIAKDSAETLAMSSSAHVSFMGVSLTIMLSRKGRKTKGLKINVNS